MRKIFTLILICTLVLSAVGCSQKETTTATSESKALETKSTEEVQKTESTKESNAGNEDTDSEETYLFTDSSGREVELPKNIERIAPSGPLAQIVLYTLCPEKMVGWASEFTDEQLKYIDNKYASAPVFGNFYGDTLNLEAVMTAHPQVVFDIGEAKSTVKEDMDGIQDKTGIPTVFVHMEMDTMTEAYETLGKIVGEEEQAQKIIEYIEKTQSDTQEKLKEIPESERKSIYYGQDEGLSAVVAGTVHSDVIEYAGGINTAVVEETVRGGASEVSMEQLLLWNPKVILFAPKSIYDSVEEKAEWKELEAVKSGAYYEVPSGPYNWMGRPPSINRIIGVKWLSNLLYPDVFDYDMVKETKEFYKLFYHCDITDEQVKDLLTKSTYK
jgi:iron complex transport system substrate-binding protein